MKDTGEGFQRDRWGVAHVRGSDLRDVYRGSGARACPGPGPADAVHAHPRAGQGERVPRCERRVAGHRHVLPEDELDRRHGRPDGRAHPGSPAADRRVLRRRQRRLRPVHSLGAEAAGVPARTVDPGRQPPPRPDDRLPDPVPGPGRARTVHRRNGPGRHFEGEARGAVPGQARRPGCRPAARGAARRARGPRRAVRELRRPDDGVEQLGRVRLAHGLGLPDPLERHPPRGEPAARGVLRGRGGDPRPLGDRGDDAGASGVHRRPHARPRLGRHLPLHGRHGLVGRALPGREVLAGGRVRCRHVEGVPPAHRHHPPQGEGPRGGDVLGERPRRARRRSATGGAVPRHPVGGVGVGCSFPERFRGHLPRAHGRGGQGPPRQAGDGVELGVRRPPGVHRLPDVGPAPAPAGPGRAASSRCRAGTRATTGRALPIRPSCRGR